MKNCSTCLKRIPIQSPHVVVQANALVQIDDDRGHVGYGFVDLELSYHIDCAPKAVDIALDFAAIRRILDDLTAQSPD